MSRMKAYLACISMALLWIFPAAAQVQEGQKLVQARLLSASRLVVPGKPLKLGLHFKITPKWHIYWKNPGDSGMPISVTWQVPEGFQISELKWPTPKKYLEEDLVSLGYSDEVVLLATLKTPPTISQDKVQLAAELSWLVCQTSCIPEDGTVQLELPVGSEMPASSDAGLLERFEEQVPRKPSAETLTVENAVLSSPEKGKELLEVRWGGREADSVIDFFPEPLEQFSITHSEIQVKDGKLRLPLSESTDGATLENLVGIALVRKEGKDVGYEVVIPVKNTPASATEGSVNPSGNVLGQDFKVEVSGGTQSLTLGGILFLAFFGGVILNLMPCVLPVLSLKILGFISQRDQSRREIFQQSLVYTLGVLVSFWILAAFIIVLREGGAQIGWGFQFQSPWFVILMSAVVLIFGLNLLGVFEFEGPNLGDGTHNILQKPTLKGAFANGVLATTLATPCMAPMLGTAVGFAFSQSALKILLIFSMVGFGLSAPYLLLSVFPTWSRFLPKPGNWMIRFKQAMGFLLLATVIWLLSILGSQLGANAVVFSLVFLLTLSFACWLLGQWIDFNTSRLKRVVLWICAFCLSGASFLWMYNAAWKEALENPETIISSNNSSGTSFSQKIHWNPFTLNSLEELVRNGNTVFIDFTADWCFTCKVNEKAVIETEAVRNKLMEYQIIPVKADWTRRNPEITQLLKKFGRSGVPLYVIFPAGKLDEPLMLPEVITQKMLLEAFEKAGPSKTGKLSLQNASNN